MVYHIEKTIKGKKYHYLVKNVRINNKWKKFTAYIGKGELSNNDIKKLKQKYSTLLEKKVNNFLKSTDPLYSLLSEKQIKELEEIKQKYKSYKKMLPEVWQKYYEWFLTQFTYNTSAIEGSTVTLRETSMILFDKITPPGKTLREIREIENHKKAFDFILSYKKDVNKNFVCRIHKILSIDILSKDNCGKFRKVQVFIRGVKDFIPPKPQFVEKEFKELMNWYNKNKKKYHPLIVASYMHTTFESIHPFVDFNGRTGRLLLNFILIKNEFPAIDIKNKDRIKYYNALQKAQKGNLKPFVNLVLKYLKEMKSLF